MLIYFFQFIYFHICDIFYVQGHALVQFEAEESKTAALLKNRNSIKGHIISVQPSKFPAVVPVIARSANEQTSKGGGSSSGAGKSERTGFYHSLSSAEKTHESRFNPYLSTSGSGHSDSSTGQKRTKLRYKFMLL